MLFRNFFLNVKIKQCCWITKFAKIKHKTCLHPYTLHPNVNLNFWILSFKICFNYFVNRWPTYKNGFLRRGLHGWADAGTSEPDRQPSSGQNVSPGAVGNVERNYPENVKSDKHRKDSSPVIRWRVPVKKIEKCSKKDRNDSYRTNERS